jgi:ornithine cyclodeaminase
MNTSTLPVRQGAQTLFLSATDAAQLVRSEGIAPVLQGMLNAIHADFLRWHDFQKCARLAHHSSDGVIELMPVSNAHTYAFKYVNGHPTNHRHQLPTVMAFGVLADVATGLPVFLCELTLTTALRTAATSAMAARTLARTDSHTMALIGNGAQAEFQALAFHHVLGIQHLRLFDTDPAATHKLQNNLAHTALTLTPCSSIAECIKGADIVTTLTANKLQASILLKDALTPGMHINAVGGDGPGKTELHPDVLHASKVFVEYEPQTRVEGDLQHLPADFVVTELWQVLQDPTRGRQSDADITLFDSVGFALEDFSALRYLHQLAQKHTAGQWVDLVPTLPNPKDLFSLIRPQTPNQGA